MFNLRPYQEACIRAVDASWDEANRVLCVLPTGAGKTIIAAGVTKSAVESGNRVLFLAHREELLTQTIDKFKRSAGVVAELEKAEHRASLTAKAVVASVQTLTSRADRWPQDHFDIVIVDEAHHALADSYLRILRRFDGHANVIGITATPDRADRRNLGVYFERVAYEISLVDLIRQGYLAPITIRAIPLPIDLGGVSSTAGDFDATETASAIEPHLGAIAAAIRQHAAGRRTLAFLPLIATSEKFVAACRAAGLSAMHVDGYDEHRAAKLAAFARFDVEVLSNAMLLTEGYDDPGIDCLVVLRPTRSRALYAQMVGRGTRPAWGKENLLLLDFLWMHERHTVCRPASLIAATEDEAASITDEVAKQGGGDDGAAEVDLLTAQTDAASAREEKLREEIRKCAVKSAKTISAEQFALAHDALAVAEYQPALPWESQAITGPQEKALRMAKIDLATVRGRGHASQLLNLHFKAQSLTLCSPKQRALLARMGHPSPSTATVPEFRKFMGRLKS